MCAYITWSWCCTDNYSININVLRTGWLTVHRLGTRHHCRELELTVRLLALTNNTTLIVLTLIKAFNTYSKCTITCLQ